MKLIAVIEVWDKLHTKNTGDLGFCDLEKAIDEVEGVENDIKKWRKRIQLQIKSLHFKSVVMWRRQLPPHDEL